MRACVWAHMLLLLYTPLSKADAARDESIKKRYSSIRPSYDETAIETEHDFGAESSESQFYLWRKKYSSRTTLRALSRCEPPHLGILPMYSGMYWELIFLGTSVSFKTIKGLYQTRLWKQFSAKLEINDQTRWFYCVQVVISLRRIKGC